MRKRLRKKMYQKELIKEFAHDGFDPLRCMNCGAKINVLIEFQREWGVCNSNCYKRYVGIYA